MIEQPELLQVKLKLSIVNSEATGNGGQKSTPKSTLKSTLKGTLKGTRKNIVEMIESNPAITLNEIAEQLGKNPRGIDKHIKQLQDQGIIRRIGPANGGYWEIITSED